MLTRCVLVLIASCLVSEPEPSDRGLPLGDYSARRATLRKTLDGVVVLFGRAEREFTEDRDGFFQEPNFLYLSGWNQPGAVLAMSRTEEILFLPDRTERTEFITGPRLGPADKNATNVSGFAKVLPRARLAEQVVRLLKAAGKLYVLPTDPEVQKLAPALPHKPLMSAVPLLMRMRMKKSERELALLQRSADATMAGHVAVWNRLAAGLHEYQLAATLMNDYREAGCERNAFPPIVASGPHPAIVHYWQNRRAVRPGELVLIDAGAECASYAADIARTVPVDGKFTPRHREIYEVVLGAQKAVIAAVKESQCMGPNRSLLRIAADYINTHGKDRNGGALGKYSPAGIGHSVGLEAHDIFDPEAPLVAGTVITTEPEIHIPDENISIRVEDMILVTEAGSELLTSNLPKEVDEIEAALSK